MTKGDISLLGLCARAGKATSGEFSVESSIKRGKARLVLIASDASDNTKKKFGNMCRYRSVPFGIVSDREALGRSIGKADRTVVSIEDEGFAKSIAQKNHIGAFEGGNA